MEIFEEDYKWRIFKLALLNLRHSKWNTKYEVVYQPFKTS